MQEQIVMLQQQQQRQQLILEKLRAELIKQLEENIVERSRNGLSAGSKHSRWQAIFNEIDLTD
jgi:uncharacterized protein (UPF0254 family)